MITIEELKKLKEEAKIPNEKSIELNEEELELVSGGKTIDSLDGLNDKDVGSEFEYDGVCYFNSCLSAKDSKGRLCFIYVAKNGGGMVLIPQEM